MPIFLFHGANQADARQELNKWQNGFLEKHSELNLEIFTETARSQEFLNVALTLPFLGDKRLVIVHDYWTNKNKDDQELALTKLNQIPESTILVFYESSPLDKRLKTTKELFNLCQTKEFPALNKNNLPQYIKEQIEQYNQNIDFQLTIELGHQFSEHPHRIKTELEKLSTYCDQIITKEDIRNVSCLPFHDSVFDLTDAITSKNTNRKLQILHHLYHSGEDLIRLFYLLTSQIRMLIIAHLVKGNFNQVKELKIHPFVQKKLSQQIRTISLNKLYSLYQKLFEIDLAIKTGQIRTNKGNQTEILFAMERFLAN